MQKFLRIAKSVKAATALASTLVNVDLAGTVSSTANTAVLLRVKDSPTATLDTVTLTLATGADSSRNAIISAITTASLGKSSTATSAFVLDSLPTSTTISTTIA